MSLDSFIHPNPIIVANFEGSNKQNDYSLSFTNKDSLKAKEDPRLFVFNPNTVTKEQLIKLGVSEKTANTFIKYRNSGAIFRKKEDLKKVYGLNENLYLKLEPYILINATDETADEKKVIHTHSKTNAIKQIELNTADSASLLPLPGIGSSYAKRIIKYRNLLGGFNNIEQLREVYGFNDSLFNAIKSFVTVDAGKILPIDLNTENFKELNAHPYISYEETKAIFNYRHKNGPIKSKEVLKDILSEETIHKIESYLKFNN